MRTWGFPPKVKDSGTLAQSLSRLVTKRLLLVALAALTVEFVVVMVEFDADWDDVREEVLREEAHRLASFVRIDARGGMVLDYPGEDTVPFFTHSRDYGFQVVDHSGRLLAESGLGEVGAKVWTLPVTLEQEPDYWWQSGPSIPGGGEDSLVASQRHWLGGTPFLVRIAVIRDTHHIFRWGLVGRLVDHIAVPMLPLIALMLTVSIIAVRRSLAPLSRAAAMASALDPHQGGLQLPDEGLPSEVRALVEAINALLARLDEAMRFQREFTADVAHELRTPLAVLILQLEEVHLPSVQKARRGALAMSRLVNQLLRLAQMEVLTIHPEQTVDLAAVAGEVVAHLAPLALDQGRELAFEDYGAATVRGSSDAIAGAVRNLVENALRLTPPATTVTISTGPGPVVSVRDQGPGVPESMREAVFRRFSVGEGQLRGSAGLGLSIVQKTMAAHGGTVGVADADGGGAIFTMRFPGLSVPVDRG